MADAGAAAKPLGDVGHVNLGLRLQPVGIERLDGGGEQQVAAARRQQLAVAVERARILAEILAGAELQWIDEQRGDHDIGQRSRPVHQRQMAFVQIAHGRYQRDGSPRHAVLVQPLAQRRNIVQRLHQKQCSSAGKRRDLTASS